MSIFVGLYIWNMGVEFMFVLMCYCILEVEKVGFYFFWIIDYIVILFDDVEGFGGRYMDFLLIFVWFGG